ncbi:MAG TPA: phosphate regulon sensor histidine kinase PhoR [Burkholderiaceae bacterium]|nr:phosphate regulon sensor histidine kinase PhoR [Burkholderiaceae bacterium]
MLWRLCFFVFFQLSGALAGWLFAGGELAIASSWIGAVAGMLAGGLVWFLIDFSRSARLLRWLRVGDPASAPAMRGAWGEAADRTRRLLRAREQKVQDSQNRLQEFLAAIQASPNGVVLLDAQGRIEWCNQTAAEHLGFDALRDLQQHIGNLVRDPGFINYFAGNNFSHEVVIPGRDNTPARPSRLSVHLHPYGEGRRLLLSRDVTALEQADAMRRDFVANVSHEIRTPLTVLTGFVETLQSLPLGEQERARYLGLMAQQTDRMQTLVNDLLTLSRLEGSPPPGAGEWIAVRSLMARTGQEAQLLSETLGAKSSAAADQPPALRHQLTFDSAPDCEVSGSLNELLSAMSNLAGNAVRYTPPGGQIRGSWKVLPDGRAEFSVQDSGPGIAAEHIPRLTERFYRVDRSRSRETGGTGLGLAIVKHVVQRHGAELRVESAPGRGSRFTIVFPASRIKLAVDHRAAMAPAP